MRTKANLIGIPLEKSLPPLTDTRQSDVEGAPLPRLRDWGRQGCMCMHDYSYIRPLDRQGASIAIEPRYRLGYLGGSDLND